MAPENLDFTLDGSVCLSRKHLRFEAELRSLQERDWRVERFRNGPERRIKSKVSVLSCEADDCRLCVCVNASMNISTSVYLVSLRARTHNRRVAVGNTYFISV